MKVSLTEHKEMYNLPNSDPLRVKLILRQVKSKFQEAYFLMYDTNL